MAYTTGDRVHIVACEDDPRAAGRTGVIVDAVPPGPLTGGRWTVHRISPCIGSVLVADHEIRPA